jgi:hypothetical protein
MESFPIAPHATFGKMFVKKCFEENLINGTAYDYLDAEG